MLIGTGKLHCGRGTMTVEIKPASEKSDLSEYRINILHDVMALRDDWLRLQREDTCECYQTFDWVRIACETIDKNHQPVMILVSRDNVPQFILPLVLEKGFPSILRWPGGSHTNIGTGLFARSYLENPEPGLMQKIIGRLRSACGDTTVLYLKNQPDKIREFENPLLELGQVDAPNPLYAMDVTIGFDAILDQGSGKRKRKLYRRQVREAENLGGHELVMPDNPAEIRDILDLFFALKAERLRELGVSDVFEAEEVREFKTQLALHPETEGCRPLGFYVLKVGKIPRALYGVGIVGDRCNACVNAVVFDEFSELSPGEMILYEMLQELCDSNFTYFDIGVGQERYKNSWCKTPLPLRETIHALGATAYPFSALMRYRTRLKHQIKSSDVIWNSIKQLRKRGSTSRT